MPVAVLSGFGLSLAAPLIARVGRWRGWVFALLPLALTVYFLTFAPAITDGETITTTFDWVPSLGVQLSFALDGLSWVFALIVTGIGFAIFVYAGAYFGEDPLVGRFYAYILMFMASMLGVVLSNNLVTLFVFWELTSFSSYLLIGFKHKEDEARKAALQALLVTGGGGLALMAGLILLGLAGGTFEISALIAGEDLTGHANYIPIVLLIMAGAFTKSAQVPFHFWLPGAMAAPSPVSAYLHSATMVKAGVYLLARFAPVLGGTALWRGGLLIVGGATLLIGAYLSLRHADLKRILAYSTVSSLGALVFLLGFDTPLAAEAAMVFLIVHSFYKGALFLIAGIIEHETGTRNVTELGGLARKMPIVALATAVAALSMAGIPPLLGFVGKELLYETTLESATVPALVTALAVVSNAILVAAAALVFFKPFTGPLVETPKDPHRVPFGMWLGPMLLGIGSVAAGLLIGLVGTTFIGPAASAIGAEPVEVHLALWHGVNTMLILSVITVVAGVVIYRFRDVYQRVTDRFDTSERWGPARVYERSLDALLAFAGLQTRVLQHGYLRVYLLTISVVIALLLGMTLVTHWDGAAFNLNAELRVPEAAIAVLIAVAMGYVLRARSRLAAVVSLGVVGYGIALIFMIYGAPDLAMTQFAIETLTVILMVLVLYRLPPFATFSPRGQRLRDAVAATSVGAVITVLVLLAISTEPQTMLASYFAENSYTEAQGRNIVNVILVDFRGIDTLGEITVLAVAAFGVFALLRLRPLSRPPVDLTSAVERDEIEENGASQEPAEAQTEGESS
ncbi:MAG: putative monovalent cation/H+ antiporter subunit A [Chloroflexi bacterium]|nr:putative monovalent cation/H+ antiporter subunit A [Chloroflexota bacterium]